MITGIRSASEPATAASEMPRTWPIKTPLYFTGEPIVRPFTESRKYRIIGTGRENSRADPSRTRVTIRIAAPMRTNAPILAGLAGLLISGCRSFLAAAGEERPHRRIARADEFAGRTRRRHRAGDVIQENRVIGHGKNTVEFVRHHHDRRAKVVAQMQNQLIEPARSERVEAGGRLVEEQN